MEVEIQDVRFGGGGAGKGAELADEGEKGGERGFGVEEGDVQERAGVDDVMDCFEGV